MPRYSERVRQQSTCDAEKMKQVFRLAVVLAVGGGFLFFIAFQILLSSSGNSNRLARLGDVNTMQVPPNVSKPVMTNTKRVVTLTSDRKQDRQPPPLPATVKAQPPPPPPSSTFLQKVTNLVSPSEQEYPPQTPVRPQAPYDPWGPYPDWWLQSWPRSAVSGNLHQFVGDKPFFPPCTSDPSDKSQTPFVEPKNYLATSRNPCWYEQPKTKSKLRCVPYLYLAGVAKGGTTDIARRLRKHHQVFEGTKKEYHWWERLRFGSYEEDEGDGKVQSFKGYLDDITGNGMNDIQEELASVGESKRVFGDYSPSYLWDPRHWDSLEGNEGCLEPRMIIGQHILHVYPKAKIILTFRHPTPRLYSRFMSRIHRTSVLKKVTLEDFHQYVVHGVKVYRKCFDQWSIRHCAYSMSVYQESMVRLVEGMYPVFMADWLRVWPRNQIFIMRYEDYGGHEGERLTELIDFLELDPMNQSDMDEALDANVANAGTVEYQKYGPMLPETKKLLDDFYQPFIQQFAEILNETRFLWKDVYEPSK